MSSALPFKEISPWVEAPEDLQPSLAGELRADVVVVGGGYTGLSTALSLRAQGIDVVLLEQGFAGSGASGRNAGHLTPTIGKDIPTLLRVFGRERASKLVRFADAAVEYTEETIRKHRIACDYVPSGNIMAGVHAKQESGLRKAAETARALDAQVRFIAADEMRERGVPEAFRFGVLEECGGTLHPGRYVMGLRAAALAAGVRVFENTKLTALDDGARVRARSQGGSVEADFAVLATNAYTTSTGRLPRAVSPVRVSLFESEPLDDSQLEAIGWRGREGIYTAHEMLESYRLTQHRTIVGGSKLVRYAWGNGLSPGYDPGAFSLIESAFRERFPALHDVSVSHFWGGWIGIALDFLPMLRVEGTRKNILAGIGFAGHGVAQATLMGEMLAERVHGRVHEWEPAIQRRVYSWPPEPIRWLGAKVLIGALSAIDRRTDRQIRAARQK